MSEQTITIIGWVVCAASVSLNAAQWFYRRWVGRKNAAECKAMQDAWHGPPKPWWLQPSLQGQPVVRIIRWEQAYDLTAGMAKLTEDENAPSNPQVGTPCHRHRVRHTTESESESRTWHGLPDASHTRGPAPPDEPHMEQP